MKKVLLVSLLCCGLNAAYAGNFKTLKDEQATLQLCQQSAEVFNQTLDIKNLTDILRPYFAIPEKMDVSDNFEAKQTINLLKPIIGKPITTVHIDTKKYAKDNFIQHRFLLKRENNALYYQCTFYKPVNEWTLVGYTFHDNPAVLNE